MKQFVAEIKLLDDKIDALLLQDEEKQKIMKCVQTCKGVGPTIAKTLVIDLPELGKVDRVKNVKKTLTGVVFSLVFTLAAWVTLFDDTNDAITSSMAVVSACRDSVSDLIMVSP